MKPLRAAAYVLGYGFGRLLCAADAIAGRRQAAHDAQEAARHIVRDPFEPVPLDDLLHGDLPDQHRWLMIHGRLAIAAAVDDVVARWTQEQNR